MKLGKRLKHIESMVAPGYDHIWDCCCDHGLLGAALLSRQAAPVIHFVDIVPELLDQLKIKLTHFYPKDSKSSSSSQWRVHCINVSELPLQQFSGKHLVIIAGVGGDLMIELIKKIHQKNINIDFLLCPVHHQFALRKELIELKFSLKHEALITENHRFYEVLLVSSSTHETHTKITPVGNLIWQSNTTEQLKVAEDYLQKTIAHYKRKKLHENNNTQFIIDAYDAVAITLLPQNKQD